MHVTTYSCDQQHRSTTNAGCRSSSLIGLELDDTQEQMLLSITRLHCRLGVEHGRASTTVERRRQIIEEIQSLKTMRDDLIAEWRNNSNS
ncbi:hypothetical protein [Paenibacillus brasilensis]|uniref:Uncharacterized protein n=1 Tax=Paenibacillus brasilensis TaxID=128574 RepID=A0ABU0L5N3_9BACL|nr:hypothetical protein [Paenibacillus brasilensis]MDQ0496550.1 hypothetical protein [Paenibacillus brasilensis]